MTQNINTTMELIKKDMIYIREKLDSIHDKIEIQNGRIFKNSINITRIITIGSVLVFIIPLLIAVLLQ